MRRRLRRAGAARSVLVGASAGLTQRDAVAAHPADAGVLSVDRSRQRVALAPAVVRAERDGGSSRCRLWAGGEECPLPLPRQAVGTQDGAVRSSAPTLAGFVRSQFRSPAL